MLVQKILVKIALITEQILKIFSEASLPACQRFANEEFS